MVYDEPSGFLFMDKKATMFLIGCATLIDCGSVLVAWGCEGIFVQQKQKSDPDTSFLPRFSVWPLQDFCRAWL